MNINDYRQKYAELEQNIANARAEFEFFKMSAKND